jgi:hypothetical protein
MENSKTIVLYFGSQSESDVALEIEETDEMNDVRCIPVGQREK